MKSRLLVAALMLSAHGAAVAQQNRLEVILHGVAHERGPLRVSLYADPDSFRKEDRALSLLSVAARPGSVTAVFDDLVPGRYAVMAYHDEDGNGTLNRRFGMFPIEGYGLSNNPTVVGPPGFADSAFEIPAANGRIDIELRY